MLRSVTVKFLPEMFGQIKMIAKKRGETIFDTVRHLLKGGAESRVNWLGFLIFINCNNTQ